ncbi:hypothetical protein Micbo1qcDRAFT_69958 [Microdochium bolleyi]|uniref:Uncharacterized protein n=1 Tax=Microdochium bolleyi TaxID=196109 RepID=A0A136J1Z8_9PEZI|nr:hypothetical protein Micbo1qcDRAFT_69958 [Microdochium bolleyi]
MDHGLAWSASVCILLSSRGCGYQMSCDKRGPRFPETRIPLEDGVLSVQLPLLKMTPCVDLEVENLLDFKIPASITSDKGSAAPLSGAPAETLFAVPVILSEHYDDAQLLPEQVARRAQKRERGKGKMEKK